MTNVRKASYGWPIATEDYRWLVAVDRARAVVPQPSEERVAGNPLDRAIGAFLSVIRIGQRYAVLIYSMTLIGVVVAALFLGL
jgi:hypothetical protein